MPSHKNKSILGLVLTAFYYTSRWAWLAELTAITLISFWEHWLWKAAHVNDVYEPSSNFLPSNSPIIHLFLPSHTIEGGRLIKREDHRFGEEDELTKFGLFGFEEFEFGGFFGGEHVAAALFSFSWSLTPFILINRQDHEFGGDLFSIFGFEFGGLFWTEFVAASALFSGTFSWSPAPFILHYVMRAQNQLTKNIFEKRARAC